MNVSITVRHCGETTTLRAEAGTPLAPLLREAGLLTLPCGVGKCGKCLILAATEPCAEERALLGDAALASGCASPVTPAPLRGSTSPFRRPGPCACSPGSRNRTTRSGPSWSAAPSPCPSRPSTTSAATCNASSTPAAQRATPSASASSPPCPPSYATPAPTAGAATGTATCAASASCMGKPSSAIRPRMRHTPLSWTSAPPPSPPCSWTRHAGAWSRHAANTTPNRPTARTSSAASATKRNGKNTATARTRCNRPSPSRFPQCSPGCWNRPGSATWTSCP